MSFPCRDDVTGRVAMSNSTYFRQQVERCLRLARMCSDNAVAERLREMAVEFQEQARSTREDEAGFPSQPSEPRVAGQR